MAYVYEHADRDFLQLAAAVVYQTIELKNDMVRKAEANARAK